MKIKDGFVLRSVMGQNVVLAEGSDSESYGKIITLNESAAILWRELKQKSFEPSDAADILVARFGIDSDQALADAKYIIQRMADKGLLEE